MRSKTQKVKEILNHIRPDQSLEEMMVEIRARLGGLDMNLGEHLYSYNLVIEAIATQAIAKQEEQAPIQSSQGLVGFLRQSPAAAAADAHSGIEEAPMRPGP